MAIPLATAGQHGHSTHARFLSQVVRGDRPEVLVWGGYCSASISASIGSMAGMPKSCSVNGDSGLVPRSAFTICNASAFTCRSSWLYSHVDSSERRYRCWLLGGWCRAGAIMITTLWPPRRAGDHRRWQIDAYRRINQVVKQTSTTRDRLEGQGSSVAGVCRAPMYRERTHGGLRARL
jgi:hypothetical protein